MKLVQFLWYLFIACIEVHLNQLLPAALQRRLAERRLIRTIRAAYENVPFYRQKYDEAGIDINSIRSADDIKKLPFLTKDEVLLNFPQSIVARGVNIDDCHYSATTGSTGRSLRRSMCESRLELNRSYSPVISPWNQEPQSTAL